MKTPKLVFRTLDNTSYTTSGDSTSLKYEFNIGGIGKKEYMTITREDPLAFTLTFNGTISADNIDNMTVTHKTNVCESQTTPQTGRFCEATGEIYDGYTEVKVTDCICKVKLSTELSAKVVGIITSENQFASHGDVLVVVDEGTMYV
jgi:hypothetical protein